MNHELRPVLIYPIIFFQRLTDPKLKSLYSDLMIQDKEELTLKRLKSDGSDKEGLKEAEIRRKLTNIMSVYGLREHFDDDAPPRHKDHAVCIQLLPLFS